MQLKMILWLVQEWDRIPIKMWTWGFELGFVSFLDKANTWIWMDLGPNNDFLGHPNSTGQDDVCEIFDISHLSLSQTWHLATLLLQSFAINGDILTYTAIFFGQSNYLKTSNKRYFRYPKVPINWPMADRHWMLPGKRWELLKFKHRLFNKSHPPTSTVVGKRRETRDFDGWFGLWRGHWKGGPWTNFGCSPVPFEDFYKTFSLVAGSEISGCIMLYPLCEGWFYCDIACAILLNNMNASKKNQVFQAPWCW